MPETVYILDEVTVCAGVAAEFRNAYLDGYAVAARARGMTLEHVRLSPPFEWEEGSNTLHFLWSVAGPEGWWAMRVGGVDGRPLDHTGGNADWWNAVSHLIVDRRRLVLGDFEPKRS